MSISLRRTVKFYLVVFAVLLSLNLVAVTLKELGHENAKGFVPLFHFDAEENAPTLFSVFLLIQVSIVCLIISKYNVPDRKYWLALSIIFALLSLDEYFEIHEQLISPVSTAFSTGGFFDSAWIIPYGVLVLALGIFLLRWLLRLPKETLMGISISALLFLMGAILVEGLGAWWASGPGDKDDLAYGLMTTVEESLEMLGPIVFVYFAVSYLSAESGNIKIEFGE